MAAADLVLAAGVTAVVAYNDVVALGLLSRFRTRSVRVPAQISVIGVDDIAMSAMVHPSLTTVALPTEQTGRAGVDLLLALLEEPDRGGATRRELDTQLMVRGSTGSGPDAPEGTLAMRRMPLVTAVAAVTARWPRAARRTPAAAARRARGPVPDKPASAVTLNILDVAGNLQLTQGMIDDFVEKHSDIVSKVTYSKAPAPELVGKIKAQQGANRVDIDLVLTGVDGLAAGIEQGLWTPLLPTYADRLPGMKDYLPGAAAMQELAGTRAWRSPTTRPGR